MLSPCPRAAEIPQTPAATMTVARTCRAKWDLERIELSIRSLLPARSVVVRKQAQRNTSTRLITGARESGSVPHPGTARESRGSWWACGGGLSVRARAEITRKYAGAYAKASKKDKGRMPGRGVRGDRLEPGGCQAAPEGGGQASWRSWQARAQDQGAQSTRCDALKVLQRVWAASGGGVAASTDEYQCLCYRGLLEAAGELAEGTDRYSQDVRREPGVDERDRPSTAIPPPAKGPAARQERHQWSARRLRSARQDPQGRRARPVQSPGFFEARYRRSLWPGARRGEFARTGNMTNRVHRPGPSPGPCVGGAEKHARGSPGPGRGRHPLPHHGHGLPNNGSEFTQPRRWPGGQRTRHVYSRPGPAVREERPGHHPCPRTTTR
ncbi:hypothetical protein SAMN05216355_1162 [Actinomyces ruminicola]|uniref:Uncharacterized protein n=1 Tax=Actinomyces ruminicola TaxID=332524 RepID=A0A1H0EGJ2_9ACTO|nr:hypothetical protein SAMN05216355_1162 [Actinomyces ruminicola]